MEEDVLLREQLAYYRARAGEYDEWFFRTGRYDRGAAHRAEWLEEVGVVDGALRELLAPGAVLELACGTGLWTRRLAELHHSVVAVDASPETIAFNRQRVHSERVTYHVVDLFGWTPPPHAFDAVFFGFWLSHVPMSRFDEFWQLVRSALKPGGTAFFVDSLADQASTATNHDPIDESGVVRRKLNDGREFSIVKVFHEPAVLEQRLREGGWSGQVQTSGRFFLYGSFQANI